MRLDVIRSADQVCSCCASSVQKCSSKACDQNPGPHPSTKQLVCIHPVRVELSASKFALDHPDRWRALWRTRSRMCVDYLSGERRQSKASTTRYCECRARPLSFSARNPSRDSGHSLSFCYRFFGCDRLLRCCFQVCSSCPTTFLVRTDLRYGGPPVHDLRSPATFAAQPAILIFLLFHTTRDSYIRGWTSHCPRRTCVSEMNRPTSQGFQ